MTPVKGRVTCAGPAHSAWPSSRRRRRGDSRGCGLPGRPACGRVRVEPGLRPPPRRTHALQQAQLLLCVRCLMSDFFIVECLCLVVGRVVVVFVVVFVVVVVVVVVAVIVFVIDIVIIIIYLVFVVVASSS